MKSKAVHFLESHQSDAPSQFIKDAQWRKENESWLRLSRQFATSLMVYMQEHQIKRAELANLLNVSPQYISRLLSGKENLSFKSIAHIEDTLGINCMTIL